ncbi:SDR family NAD(P)-dependent oxidoreductase [Actinoallomurus iriomotensis]|uniref:SDR family NAD(P)-dependent oxidoreductase n=1 Tax=Actinoallomurus iriomotensis TaxID=478107 RepID=UPI00255539F0|nr:SDR family NAD(P)-dependent oxidoreductase [Actinoallomurus iriomotensis]
MTSRAGNQRTWIITGASAGFGRAIAERAAGQGDNVVLAVRRPASVADLAAAHRDRVLVIEFDVCDTGRAGDVVRSALDRFGRVDVLVNNAGRGVVGAAEEVGEEELRASLELHLLGPAALVRAVLPFFREQKSGTIVQMSSQGGRISFPGVGAYSAGKFALEGWSEALAGEVAPFGVRVMLVEPSRFRTSFNAPDVLRFAGSSPVYAGVLGAVRDDMAGADGVQEGDPVRAAEIIVDLVAGEELPLRLPLGREAVERIGRSYRRGLDELERWAPTAHAADFPDAATSARPI